MSRGSSSGGGGVSMGVGGRRETIVMDTSKRRSTCGYCKSPGYPSVSHGLLASSLTVEDYQELLDRGWRRSGSFLYKPDMKRTCCRQYTIRLKADEFIPSKEHVRVRKKMERFLNGNLLKKNGNCLKVPIDQNNKPFSIGAVSEKQTPRNQQMHEEDNYASYLSGRIDAAIEMCLKNGEFPSVVTLPNAIVKEVRPGTKRKLAAISEDLMYTSSISFQIAAALIRGSPTEVPSLENESGAIVKLSPSVVAEKLACSLNVLGITLDFTVKACNGHLNFYSSTMKIPSIQFPSVRDITVTFDDMEATTSQRHKIDVDSVMPQKKHILRVRMKRSSFDPEEYALYRKYQVNVHNDKPEDISEISYTMFLVETPLIFSPPQSGKVTPSCGFGSFHQQYLIDGKLIAVGVVDVLPKCLSSKYLFWDPDFASLSIGKFSAMKEIEWVKETHDQCHSIQYYYLGYYIHSCSKMRYKADYYPSELLCPLRYQWVPFHIARPLLDKKPYVVLSDFVMADNRESSNKAASLDLSADRGGDSKHGVPNNSFDDEDEEIESCNESESEPEDDREASVVADTIKNIIIDLNGRRMRFKDLEQFVGSDKREILEALRVRLHRYVKVVGPQLAGSIIYLLK